MITPVPGTPGAAATVEESSRTRRVGHVYLDVRRRVLSCLNGTARRLNKEGVPFTPADLASRQLFHLTGDLVRPDDLPLIVSWREVRLVENTLILERPANPTCHVHWHTARCPRHRW